MVMTSASRCFQLSMLTLYSRSQTGCISWWNAWSLYWEDRRSGPTFKLSPSTNRRSPTNAYPPDFRAVLIWRLSSRFPEQVGDALVQALDFGKELVVPTVSRVIS
jgi:hypothetical protein